MPNYLRPQTVGDLLRNTFAVYGKGFRVIFLSYFLPVLPFGICANEAQAAENMGLYWLIFLCLFPVTLFASAAITVSVSDICLGNAPSLVRSYKKVLAVVLKLLGTNILQSIILFIGFILLVVPGIIAMMWLLFTPSVVILEGVGGFSALKRSKELAQGYNWRNLGVLLLMIIILVAIGFFIGIILGIFGALVPSVVSPFVMRILMAVLNLIGTTISLTMMVLLYYELRVRKEAYDAVALAEDLRR